MTLGVGTMRSNRVPRMDFAADVHLPFPGRSYSRKEWFKPDCNPMGIDHCGEDADRRLFHGLTERLPSTDFQYGRMESRLERGSQ